MAKDDRIKKMKRTYLVLIIGSVIGLAAIGSVLLIAGQGKADGGCSGSSTTYRVIVRDDKAVPITTKAKLCDAIRFTNQDNVTREIAFGPHEDHVAYDGIAERVLSRGQSFTITLDKAGSYRFHDHLHDEVEGYFVVSK